MCEYVGAEIPNRWKDFGIFVEVKEGDLKAIHDASQKQWKCFTEVFGFWYRGATSPYTWENVAQALVSDSIKENWLLDKLHKNLTAKQ